MLIIIGTIFLGMVFNGLTIKLISNKLGIIKKKSKILKIKKVLEKEIFLKNYQKFKKIQKMEEFNVANWQIVNTLSGLAGDYDRIKRFDGKERVTEDS